MPNTKNIKLESTTIELKEVHQELIGHRLPYDSRKKLIMVSPFIISGLWPRCERLTFQAFTQVRNKRDWKKVSKLCIRTPQTKFLYDLINSRFQQRKGKL